MARELEMARKREREKEREREMEQEWEKAREKEQARAVEREREWEVARQMEREKEIERGRRMERERAAILERQTSDTERGLARSNSSPRNDLEYGQPPHFNGRDFPAYSSDPRTVTSTKSHQTEPPPPHAVNTGQDPEECQLPNSPAPPPYKSPSPDSEQAQYLQQMGRSSIPPSQFAFHPSMLGVMPDFGTDLSGQDPENQSGLHLPLRSPRFHSRSPRLRGRSPQPRSRSLTPESGLRYSQSPTPDREIIQSVSTRRQEGESSCPEEPPETQNQLHTNSIGDSNSTIEPQSQVGSHSTEPQICTVSASGNEKENTPPRSPMPDLLRELDELIDGVQAMVSNVNLQSTEVPRAHAAETEERGGLEGGNGEEGSRGGGEGESGEEQDFTISPPPAFDIVDEQSVSDQVVLDNLASRHRGDDIIQEVAENSSVSQVDEAKHSRRGMERNLKKQTKALQRVLQRGDEEEEEEGSHTTSSGDSNPWLQGSPVLEDKLVKPEKREQVGIETIASNGVIRDNSPYEDEELRKSDLTTGVNFDMDIVLQPPSPYSEKTTGKDSSEDTTSPLFPPLPSSYVLETVGGSTEEEDDLGQVSSCSSIYWSLQSTCNLLYLKAGSQYIRALHSCIETQE